MTADTPQARRRERVAERLRAAFATLEADTTATLTPTALARLAGVGRNTLYTGHRAILDALVALRAAREPAPSPSGADRRPPESIAEMRAQLRSLATQNAGLLQRALVAERRAQQLEERNALLTRSVDKLRRPAVLVTSPDRGEQV